jgi:hypothetical protein
VAMHPLYLDCRTGTVLGSKMLGIIASGLDEECNICLAWETRGYSLLLHGTSRKMRRTLAGVFGREDVIVGFLLAKALLPLNGHTDII